jgi:predicted DNA-binding ribbon-helix-helix protein
MSKRFTVTLPDAVFKDLEDIAAKEGRSTANLAAFLIESIGDKLRKRGNCQGGICRGQ